MRDPGLEVRAGVGALVLLGGRGRSKKKDSSEDRLTKGSSGHTQLKSRSIDDEVVGFGFGGAAVGGTAVVGIVPAVEVVTVVGAPSGGVGRGRPTGRGNADDALGTAKPLLTEAAVGGGGSGVATAIDALGSGVGVATTPVAGGSG